ncbi:MAG: HD domain-containing protein [Deltaproteobacteria bacterium]|nr:HD domain-containing protein [Deltaproteobacteria bacterium]
MPPFSPADNPTLFEMLSCISTAMDLVSPMVVCHQKRTGFIAWSLGREMGLPSRELMSLLLGGMLHDCGALETPGKLEALRFDFDRDNPHEHAEAGYAFLKSFEESFPEMSGLDLAGLVRHHHVSWNQGRGQEFHGRPVSPLSHLLHLADRVEVLLRRDSAILEQAPEVSARIQNLAGSLFAPEMVEAFRGLASRESFWLDLGFSEGLNQLLTEAASNAPVVSLDLDGMLRLTAVFAQMVDFRSRYTAIHSSSVARTAGCLAAKAGFSKADQMRISIAGNLHDLGKLAVPTQILEKPGPLTPSEFNVIKAHPHQAFRLLSPLRRLGDVVDWVAFHHETLDGAGYPFHVKADDLSLGARILAAADIFTALTEDRPYRNGMPLEQTLGILKSQVQAGKLDALVVSLIEKHQEEVCQVCTGGHDARVLEYLDFQTMVRQDSLAG